MSGGVVQKHKVRICLQKWRALADKLAGGIGRLREVGHVLVYLRIQMSDSYSDHYGSL
jgi:hypothetical protein